MSTSNPSSVLPDIPQGFDLPFYYGAFTNLGIDYLVDTKDAKRLLEECEADKPLSLAEFGSGQACLSFNFQVYFAQFSNGGAVIQEIEFNLVSYPTAAAGRVPKLTYEQYAMGEDQTRTLGFCRYRVACDSELAVNAGKALFGEPKITTGFDTAIPVPNRTPVEESRQPPGERAEWHDTWRVACLEKGKPPKAGEHGQVVKRHFVFTADLRGLPARPVSTAPFTEYGFRGEGASAKALAAPLNVFHPYQWYDLKEAKKQNGGKSRVTLVLGPEPEARIKSFVDLVSAKDPVGAWVFQSPPVAVQNRPYYVSA